MDIYQYLPTDAESYINCVRMLAALIHKAMDEFEKTDFASVVDRSRSLQRLAASVETVACLRGDSGIFYASRPHNLIRYQADMYYIEDMLRARLMALGYNRTVNLFETGDNLLC